MNRRAAWVVAGALALAGVIAIFLLSRLGGVAEPPAAPDRELEVEATLEPAHVLFGDALRGAVEVRVDPARVDPASVTLEPGLAPFRLAGPVEARRERTRVRYELVFHCVSAECAPGEGGRAARPAALTVRAMREDGEGIRMRAPWPRVSIAPRVSAAEAERATPRWRADTTLPPVSYRVDPGRAAAAVTAAATLLVVVAAALLLFELRRSAQLRATNVRRRSALERALALAREAAGRERAEDRRKALALLARVLRGADDAALAHTAARLAWAAPGASATDIRALVERIERARGALR